MQNKQLNKTHSSFKQSNGNRTDSRSNGFAGPVLCGRPDEDWSRVRSWLSCQDRAGTGKLKKGADPGLHVNTQSDIKQSYSTLQIIMGKY